MNHNIQYGLSIKGSRKRNAIPYHGRRHSRLPVMGGPDKCVHSLSRHEVIHDPVAGRDITISYALPCQVGHKATTKKPVHKDAYGRTW